MPGSRTDASPTPRRTNIPTSRTRRSGRCSRRSVQAWCPMSARSTASMPSRPPSPRPASCASTRTATRSTPARSAVLSRYAPMPTLLRPTVIQARRDTLAPAKLGHALFAPQALEHDADLLLGRVLLAGTPADVLHDLLSRRLLCSVFLSHLHSLAVTMSQKPYVTKSNQMSHGR